MELIAFIFLPSDVFHFIYFCFVQSCFLLTQFQLVTPLRVSSLSLFNSFHEYHLSFVRSHRSCAFNLMIFVIPEKTFPIKLTFLNHLSKLIKFVSAACVVPPESFAAIFFP